MPFAKWHQRDRDGGVPWYVLLDAEGKELVTSNLPGSAPESAGKNFDVPGEPADVDRFVSTVRAAVPGPPEETLAAMRLGLGRSRPGVRPAAALGRAGKTFPPHRGNAQGST